MHYSEENMVFQIITKMDRQRKYTFFSKSHRKDDFSEQSCRDSKKICIFVVKVNIMPWKVKN